jgi:O-acetyl-ADP-ribose deacetylase (regulator of RNase III)
MLIYHRTSILESPAQTVVNTVNCVGVMGKGIAQTFKKRYPDMFRIYGDICARGLLVPGKLWLWHGPDQLVLNFPTKRHWRNPSRLEWIELGLKKFVHEYARRGIVEISFPRLGCGNGGLGWDDVRPLMERYLSKLPIQIYVHDYEVDIGIPEHMEAVTRELSNVTGAMRSFDGFISVVQQAIQRVGGSLIDIQSHARLTASCTHDAALAIETVAPVAA